MNPVSTPAYTNSDAEAASKNRTATAERSFSKAPAKFRFWLPSRARRAQRSDGSFVGEAELSRDTQWAQKDSGAVPETAFGMREDKTAELVSAAHAAAAADAPCDPVLARGGDIFDATWVNRRTEIESQREVALTEKKRLETKRIDVEAELRGEARLQIQPETKFSLPAGFWARAGLFIVLTVLAVILGCEWFSAASLRKYELQSLSMALLLTAPFLSVALAVKLLLRRNVSPAMRILQVAFHCVGVVAVISWLYLLAANYGTALRDDFEPPTKEATIAFTLAQFAAALAGSSWLTTLLASLFVPKAVATPNPVWDHLQKELSQIDHEINRWQLLVGREDGALAAYRASRAAWLANATEAYARTRMRLGLIQERMDLLENN